MTRNPDLKIQITLEAPSDWPKLLAADSAADFHHTTAWTRGVARNYPGFGAVWLTATLGDRLVGGLAAVHGPGRRLPIVPVYMTRLDSNLEGTSGGPLVADDLSSEQASAVFNALVAALKDLRKRPLGLCTISLNHAHDKRFGHLLQDSGHWIRRESPSAVIPLHDGLEHVEMHLMVKNKRNERNRGLRAGAEILITDDPAQLADYYPIYQASSRVWGISPAPLGFLQDLLADRSYCPSGLQYDVWLTCIRLDENVIGGHLNMLLGDRVIVWNGVTDPQYARSHFPATLAVWGDLQESCRRGAKELDLGGSGGVVSLQGFKKYFGAQDQSRGYYLLDTPLLRLANQLRRCLGKSRDDGTTSDRNGHRWHDQPRNSGGDS